MESVWMYVWRTSFNRSWTLVAVWAGYLLVGAVLCMLIADAIGMLWPSLLLVFALGWNWDNVKTWLFGDVQ